MWPGLAGAQAIDGVIIRCGASSGHGYFLSNDFFNPDGPNWEPDGISDGKIVRIRRGNEWDILFDDITGSNGYRQDGAKVFPILETDRFLTVGAFNEQYVDVFTFDLVDRVVGWTSNKHGPFTAKAAVYAADCD